MLRTIGQKITDTINKYKSSSVIIRASICFVIVSIIDKGVSLLTQPFINRILSVSEVGIYNVYHSWDSLIVVIASFYLYCGVLEVLITKDKEDSNQVAASLCFLSVIISVAFFAILFVFIKPISAKLGLKPIYFFIMGIMTVTTSIYSFWSVPKRFNYDYRIYSVVGVLVFVSKSVLSIFFAYIFSWDRVLGRLIGLCIPNVIIAVVTGIIIVKRADWLHITKYWKRAILFNLPLIPHYLSQVLLASSDRIMIQQLLPDGEVKTGLYSVAYSIAALTLIVFTAINNAYQPFAYKAISEGQYEALSKKTNAMVLISVLFASIVCLLAPEGLYILGGGKYRDAIDVIPVLVTGVFLSSFYFIFSNVEFIHEKTKYIFPITVIGAVINIGLNYILIPKFGYKAAGYTTFIGYLAIAVCHYIVSYSIEKKNIYDMKTIVLYICGLLAVSALSKLAFGIAFWIRWALIVLISISFIYFAFKKRLLGRV